MSQSPSPSRILAGTAVGGAMGFVGAATGGVAGFPPIYGTPGKVFGIALMFWIVSSIVGGLLVQFGPRDEEPEGDVARIGPAKQ